MTDEQLVALGPPFADCLGGFQSCFLTRGTFKHFQTYTRGLISDLPRKSVEPSALTAGSTARTLQEFLARHR